MPDASRILIVDDQAHARQGLRALLGTSPCAGEIREAANQEEGLRVAEEFQPHVMLVDILMPGMDGLQAIRTVREQWPNIRVIALSLSPQLRQQALQAGAEAFLTIGASPELLLATFEAIAISGAPHGGGDGAEGN